MELWDSYDKDLNRIPNKRLIRGDPIPAGLFHLVSEVIVRHKDGSYLLMQRDKRKHYGGMWEATAGGSALQNETPLECAVRELREETGISGKDILEVGRTKSFDTIYVEFLCETMCDKDSVVLQDGETIAYRWVSRSELMNMKKSDLITERMQQFIKELRPDISV